MAAPWLEVPHMVPGRTLVKSTIWSHPGQKYQIEIFSLKVAKMGKKFWRETIRTGVKFWSEILSVGQYFRIWPIWSHPGRMYRIGIFSHIAAKMGWRRCDICKPPFLRGTAFANLAKITFFILKCYLFQNKKHYLRQIRKRSPCNKRWFAYITSPPTCFGRPMAKNSNSVFSTRVRPDRSNSKILIWREYFA